MRCLSGPGREDAYESPIPIPLARFGQVASVQPQRLKNAFTVSFRKGPRVDPEGIQESGKSRKQSYLPEGDVCMVSMYSASLMDKHTLGIIGWNRTWQLGLM